MLLKAKALSIFLLIIVIVTFCFQVDSVSYGTAVSIKEMPYVVSLTTFGEYECGGAIITQFHIITAAHCIDVHGNGDPNRVVTGRSVSIGVGGLAHEIEKIYIHGKHTNMIWKNISEEYEDFDIALIKLKRPIRFNEYQQPIKISNKPAKNGEKIIICGFGTIGVNKGEAPSLRKSEVTVIDRAECKPYAKSVYVPTSLFCAGNGTTDTCVGDSGSPVVINGELVGIVSSGPECDYYPVHDHSPGLYARIDLCYDWIMEVTGIEY